MNPSRPIVGLALVLFSLTGRVHGWDDTGHMLVAQIARDHLSPTARGRVDALARTLTFAGRPYNAVTIACWADDIKHAPEGSPFRGAYRAWHYIELGCADGDPDAITNPPPTTMTEGDIVTALHRCVAVLRGADDPFIPNRAIALALLTHFVGDIHQPLHCTSRYAPGDPPRRGDAGGNRVRLTNLWGTEHENLHNFWDAAFRRHYTISGHVGLMADVNRPVAPGSWRLRRWTARLPAVERPPAPGSATDFAAWARASHALGCEVAYGQLDAPFGTPPIALTRPYVTAARELARAQIGLAGRRLAVLMEELFRTN